MSHQFKDTIRNFCEKYDIHILSSSKRAIRNRSTPQFFVNSSDKNIIHNTAREFDTEPMLTVDIPQSRLEALCDLERVFFNNIEDHGHRRVFQVWMDQQQREKEYRDKYSAVRKAYEDYSALLTWVANGGDPRKIKLSDE